MIKKLLLLILFSHSSILLFGQAGTATDPFTALGQAWSVPTSGIYHFDISGTTFSSYVEAGSGWILMASGSSATAESLYPTTTAMTLQSDNILPAAIYTSTLITDVRMNAAAGPSTPFDVQSNNATVLGNLQNDRTLSVGTNSADWTGTGTARLARNCGSNSSSLSLRIYHACGVQANMHWQVGQNSNHEKIAFSNSTKNDLNLWIRALSVPVPVKLLNFGASFQKNLGLVQLEWQTASEINNDYFTVERSINGIEWLAIEKVNGAKNSSSLLNYTAVDKDPIAGKSYYRLKQTDIDGQIKYSEVLSIYVDLFNNAHVEVHPNPVVNQLTIIGHPNELTEFAIYNELGQNVTELTQIIRTSKDKLLVDLAQLNAGFFYIKTKTKTSKVFKQ